MEESSELKAGIFQCIHDPEANLPENKLCHFKPIREKKISFGEFKCEKNSYVAMCIPGVKNILALNDSAE